MYINVGFVFLMRLGDIAFRDWALGLNCVKCKAQFLTLILVSVLNVAAAPRCHSLSGWALGAYKAMRVHQRCFFFLMRLGVIAFRGWALGLNCVNYKEQD